MDEKPINKIIYFDKETISNILQERNHGDFLNKTDISTSASNSGELAGEVTAKVNLGVPIFARIGFLFTGKIEASYFVKRDSQTTISSTEISQFEELKSSLTKISNVQLSDIENSSTAFKVAGGYARFLEAGIEGVDIKQFMEVMDVYDGYDIYKIDEKRYVRFNNSAYVSNYKRNDLLTTVMSLYCIPVGKFKKERFDFIKEIQSMERVFASVEKPQTLAELHSATEEVASKDINRDVEEKLETQQITLFDAVYACIIAEKTDGQ